jgi:hypothetical protein
VIAELGAEAEGVAVVEIVGASLVVSAMTPPMAPLP